MTFIDDLARLDKTLIAFSPPGPYYLTESEQAILREQDIITFGMRAVKDWLPRGFHDLTYSEEYRASLTHLQCGVSAPFLMHLGVVRGIPISAQWGVLSREFQWPQRGPGVGTIYRVISRNTEVEGVRKRVFLTDRVTEVQAYAYAR